MDAIKFLIKEHNHVRRVLKDINKKSRTEAAKKKIFKGLCKELVVHETMEQKVWYPNFKTNPKLNKTVKHLVTEEKTAAKAIKAFKKIKTQEKWEEKFAEFKTDVEHHAHEEETKLFPKVKKVLDKDELAEIGKKLRKFKLAHLK